jgi:hypothetical protein
MEILFNLSNLIVIPFWIMMILLPHWNWTRRVLSSLWVLVPALLLYSALVLPALAQISSLYSGMNLAAISEGLGTLQGATTTWAHLVAFDLFAGRWAYLDSRRREITAWLASPALFFILMLGPFGLLLYLLLRAAYSKNQATGTVTEA